jgi:hypothetical protein
VLVNGQLNRWIQLLAAAPVADDLIGLVAQHDEQLSGGFASTNREPGLIDTGDRIGRGQLLVMGWAFVDAKNLLAIVNSKQFKLLLLQ